MDQPTQATQLLIRLGEGDPRAPEQLLALLYTELHRLAKNYMAHERDAHTLQATALVNEAYLKFASKGGDWEDRAHFVGVAARAIRQILVDRARGQNLDPAKSVR